MEECTINQFYQFIGMKKFQHQQIIIVVLIVIHQHSYMNENPTFSQAITEYISMALHIWPALQLSLPHLHEAVAPPQDSPIRPQNFAAMNSQQFIQAMVKDLHDFILEHDVKADHIVDFLDDILAILNAEQQNDKTMRHMANELVLLISEVPQGNYTTLVNFRSVYNSVKGQNLGHVIQDQDEQSQSQSEGSYEDEQQQIQQENQHENNVESGDKSNTRMEEQVPQLTNEQKQDLQDDGWVVVKKKSKK